MGLGVKYSNIYMIWGFRTKEIVKFPMDFIKIFISNLVPVIQVICNRLRLDLPVMVVQQETSFCRNFGWNMKV